MHVETVSGTVAISLSGDVDLLVADQVSAAGLRAAASECEQIVVDLRGVTFLDSAGIGALVKVRVATRRAGQGFALRDVPDQAARILRLTGLEPVLGQLPPGRDTVDD